MRAQIPVRTASVAALLLTLSACDGAAERDAREEGVAPTAEASDDAPDVDGARASDDGDHPLGSRRTDLERFYGVYRPPDNPSREVAVSPARVTHPDRPPLPPGYLMIRARWGDVAPFYFGSVGDTSFEQRWVSPHAEAHTVVFQTGRDGRAQALEFTSGALAGYGRMERVGDLPR